MLGVAAGNCVLACVGLSTDSKIPPLDFLVTVVSIPAWPGTLIRFNFCIKLPSMNVCVTFINLNTPL